MRYPRVIDIKSGNKVADYWNHRGGRFFDQPMARAFDDLAANVGRDEFRLLYQECAAGLLTRQDQHGHGEPRTCQPRKVLRVALEISKILKACPHRARLRIRPGVKSDLWHFHFYGEVPLALVKGRERIYLEHFWNDFAADPEKSLSEGDREFYANAYAQPGHMAAGMEVFRAFPQDAEDFTAFARTKLTMPLLVLSGEKAGGPFLIEQGRMVARKVEGVLVKGSGHWLMEEAPDEVIPALVEFLRR